jgi:hypothetical protein
MVLAAAGKTIRCGVRADHNGAAIVAAAEPEQDCGYDDFDGRYDEVVAGGGGAVATAAHQCTDDAR